MTDNRDSEFIEYIDLGSRKAPRLTKCPACGLPFPRRRSSDKNVVPGHIVEAHGGHPEHFGLSPLGDHSALRPAAPAPEADGRGGEPA